MLADFLEEASAIPVRSCPPTLLELVGVAGSKRVASDWYIDHQRLNDRPMSITWRLEHPMPARVVRWSREAV